MKKTRAFLCRQFVQENWSLRICLTKEYFSLDKLGKFVYIPVMRRLPPLNALRAFEASGRLLSFARAADELGVTPAAVSHQVRALEEQLATPLFVRLTRKVALTPAGAALLPKLSEGFDALAEAVAGVRAAEETGPLAVSVAPSFAAKWLVPRIERFNAAHPDIDLLISPSGRLTDFRTDPVDAAIRYGFGDYPGLAVLPLFSETLAPMCSPSLRDGPQPLRRPADLRHHVLIHDDSTVAIGPTPDWGMWLRLAGAGEVDASRGPRFGFTEHALQAAIDGVGVTLGRKSLAAADLAAGRLVCPFELTLPSDFGYYLVCPEADAGRPKVALLRDWLLAEIARDEAAHEPPA
jgi:LysR family glycine cleavage system transcriptional activator